MLQRPRRNRKSAAIRRLTQETVLTANDLIYPLFLVLGDNVKEEITSLPGNYRWSLDMLLQEIEDCIRLGLHSFILFPKIPADKKDKTGTYGYAEDNFYLTSCREIKDRFPDICLISDVALDPYNIDGHDGIVRNGVIQNDETLEVLGQMALAQAQAGFDMLGPSDMMDGRVGYMRQLLDDRGHTDCAIMSYSAKYASAFYGPFRDALDSAPVEDPSIPKDKKSYQMNPANTREAMLEAYLDQQEGADFLMVKPAVHYLDIISILRQQTELPISCYHVSGECAMLMAACQNKWLDYNTAMPETLLSMKRAGADAIITYFAKDYVSRFL